MAACLPPHSRAQSRNRTHAHSPHSNVPAIRASVQLQDPVLQFHTTYKLQGLHLVRTNLVLVCSQSRGNVFGGWRIAACSGSLRRRKSNSNPHSSPQFCIHNKSHLLKLTTSFSAPQATGFRIPPIPELKCDSSSAGQTHIHRWGFAFKKREMLRK